MDSNHERFYWWAVPSGYLKSCNDIAPKFPYLLEELQHYLPQHNSSGDYSIIPYFELESLFKNYAVSAADILCVPLSILPGHINESGISTQVINRSFGSLVITRDLQSHNTKVDFDLRSKYSIPKCLDKTLYFPRVDSKENKSATSHRQLVDFKLFPKLDTDTNLFIARVPNELNKSHIDIINWLKSAKSIWAAGIKTFKKLSALGIKVTGTVDSLGQQELNTHFITKNFGDKWLKLTFSSNSMIAEKNSFAWYNIDFVEFDKSLLLNTHFYWMSRSNYLFALAQFPELKFKYHSSGLGSSYNFFSANLDSEHYQPFYSIEDWRKSIF